MKGYFTQLARKSGIRFESGGSTSVPGDPVRPGLPSPLKRTSKVRPLEVDQCSLAVTPSAAHPAAENTQGTAGHLQTGAPAARDTVEAQTDSSFRSSARTNDADLEEHGSNEPVAAEELATESGLSNAIALPTVSEVSYTQSTNLESGAVAFSDHGSPELTPAAGMVQSHWPFPAVENPDSLQLREQTSILQSDSASPADPFLEVPPSQNQVGSTLETNQRDDFPALLEFERDPPLRDALMEPQLIVRDYLKEVQAWVAEGPTMPAMPPMNSQSEPNRDAEEHPDRTIGAFTVEHETEGPLAPRSGRAEAPAFQDLSLSIGTISIVIEEPPKDAPLVTQPRGERSPQPNHSEPVNLSRYYLRSW
jgi:hypothetical protein